MVLVAIKPKVPPARSKLNARPLRRLARGEERRARQFPAEADRLQLLIGGAKVLLLVLLRVQVVGVLNGESAFRRLGDAAAELVLAEHLPVRRFPVEAGDL